MPIKRIIRMLSVAVVMLNFSCGKTPLGETECQGKTFTGDFESGNLSGWHKDYAVEGFSVQVVTAPVRKGSYAAKFTLRPEDFYNKGHRCEIGVYQFADYQSDMYYGWSFMLDAAYAESDEWQVVGQWHDMPDFENGESWAFYPGHSPAVAYYYRQGELGLVISAPNNRNDVIAAKKISKGQWVDVVTHIHWSTETDGYVESWVNGEQITPYNGSDYRCFRPNLYNRAGNYLLLGLYRSPEIKTTNSVYYDEVRIGGSYSEVAP